MVWGSVADFLMAGGTIAVPVVAYRALNVWKKEHVGKKKIELASEIMMTVMDFQDVLILARKTISNPMELNDIKKWLEEVNANKQNIPGAIPWSIYMDRLFLLMPIHQLNKNSEKIDKFESILNKSLIYFGENIYKLLIELHSYLGQIRHASEMLYENPNDQKLQQIAFSQNIENDPFGKRMFDIGEEIKLNLEPIYKDQQIKWKKPVKQP